MHLSNKQIQILSQIARKPTHKSQIPRNTYLALWKRDLVFSLDVEGDMYNMPYYEKEIVYLTILGWVHISTFLEHIPKPFSTILECREMVQEHGALVSNWTCSVPFFRSFEYLYIQYEGLDITKHPTKELFCIRQGLKLVASIDDKYRIKYFTSDWIPTYGTMEKFSRSKISL